MLRSEGGRVFFKALMGEAWEGEEGRRPHVKMLGATAFWCPLSPVTKLLVLVGNSCCVIDGFLSSVTSGKVSLYIPSRVDSGNPTHPHCQATLPCPGRWRWTGQVAPLLASRAPRPACLWAGRLGAPNPAPRVSAQCAWLPH